MRCALPCATHSGGTLRRQILARATRGSNSIEGLDVDDDEALAIASRESDQVFVDATWLAVKGYGDAMTYLQAVTRRPGPPLVDSTLLPRTSWCRSMIWIVSPGSTAEATSTRGMTVLVLRPTRDRIRRRFQDRRPSTRRISRDSPRARSIRCCRAEGAPEPRDDPSLHPRQRLNAANLQSLILYRE